jgi:hypothetical protein
MPSKAAQKNVPVTDQMLAQISTLSGVSVAAADIVVFDATAASTRPITKRGSIFDGATMTKAMLDEMAVILNSGTQSVPLHVSHDTYDLPIGKVFQASVEPSPDGSFDLRTLFYLPAEETELVKNINLGLTNEVSVGVQSKQMICSTCGWDYIGAGNNAMYLWDRTCPNEHTIGVDGNHLVMSGVDLWTELSLVSRGASAQARIHGQSEAIQQRLAASGISPAATMLFASSSPMKEAPVPMDPETKVAFDDLSAKFDLLMAQLTPQPDPALAAALAEVETLKAAATTKNEALEEFKASLLAGGLTASADAVPVPPVYVPTGVFKSPTRK